MLYVTVDQGSLYAFGLPAASPQPTVGRIALSYNAAALALVAELVDAQG